jgi:CubicO group peptidase (beta-lactamase class C family)
MGFFRLKNLKMYKPLFYSIIYFLIISSSYGQDKNVELQLDELLSKEFKPWQSGCAILVAKRGQIIYKKAFGNADLELNVSLMPDMVFKLASITKQFTAVAILQLVEEGKISLKQ